MAASLPTGLGFGAGYGAGVRIGYDVLYPKLQPFAQELVSGIINAVRTVWSPNGSGGAPSKTTTDSGIDVTSPAKRVAPTGKTRQAVDNCDVVRQRARNLQANILAIFRQLSGKTGKRITAQVSRNLKAQLKVKTDELNSLLNNPNNRQCVEGMKF